MALRERVKRKRAAAGEGDSPLLKESCGNGGKFCPKFCILALKWMWVQ